MTNFETGSGRGGGQQPRAGEDRQLRARVQFLTQENEELAKVMMAIELNLNLIKALTRRSIQSSDSMTKFVGL